MTAPRALSADSLPSVSAAQGRLSNRLYRQPVTTQAGWLWRFEKTPHGDGVRASCLIGDASGEALVHIALQSHLAEPEWQAYDGELQRFSFAAAHAPLFRFTDEFFPSASELLCVSAGPTHVQRPNDEWLGVDFALYEGGWLRRCVGRLTFSAQALSTAMTRHQPMVAYDWAAVPARMPLLLDELHLSAREAASLTVGSVVRVDPGDTVCARLGQATVVLEGRRRHWKVSRVN